MGFGSRWRTDFPEADAAAEITDSCRPVQGRMWLAGLEDIAVTGHSRS